MEKKTIVEILNCIQTRLVAPKGQLNKFANFKYRSCEDILEALKPLLKEYKVSLIITDEVVLIGDRYYIKAKANLSNELENIASEAYAREPEIKKGMDSSQITGATSSYARKYALNGLFCIDDSRDADHDNNASGAIIACITKQQTNIIRDGLIEVKGDEESFIKWLGISSIELMPENLFKKAMIAIETKKGRKNENN